MQSRQRRRIFRERSYSACALRENRVTATINRWGVGCTLPDHHSQGNLPKASESYWHDSVQLPTLQPLQNDMQVDVVIVGGGITGITAAYLLVREGLTVALLEANALLHGTTGHTTAKITAQHGLIYHELISHMGISNARLYYEANTEALRFIRETIHDHQVDCDLREEDACIYATADQFAAQLELEYKAYRQLGVAGELVGAIPFPIRVHHALFMKNQAQFHPLQYLAHLVQEVRNMGGHLFEGTAAIDIEEGERPTVVTRAGHRVTGNKVLACSHYPFYDGQGFYFTRMHADRSYVIAAKTEKQYPGGMYISADSPTRSLRSVKINHEEMVLIGGESHKTGQGKDTLEHYRALEIFGMEVLGLKEIRYRWSAQDLITLDKVPYIGTIASAHSNVLVATGYRKWGMTTGTAAAHILRDIVLERKNRYQLLYTPSRFYADPSLKTFLAQNADVAGHLIKGKFDMPLQSADDLAKNEGAVVSANGARAGAYRDEEGRMHLVDTTCTHLGCEVVWNHGDRTWDCPCHGSRFSYTGEVVEGPANRPLQRLQQQV